MTTHECDDRCSWRQTPESLVALGYDCPIPPHDADIPTKLACETAFTRLKHQAWIDGMIRLCTHTDRIRAHEAEQEKSRGKVHKDHHRTRRQPRSR